MHESLCCLLAIWIPQGRNASRSHVFALPHKTDSLCPIKGFVIQVEYLGRIKSFSAEHFERLVYFLDWMGNWVRELNTGLKLFFDQRGILSTGPDVPKIFDW